MRDLIQPVTRHGLADDLAQKIQQLIRKRAYVPGERLPSIAVMAANFQVGAPTVREALKTLEAVGVVNIRHGSGVYVARVDDSLVIRKPVFDGTVSKKLLLDLIEARIPIETTTVALACEHALPEHFGEMQRLLAHAGEDLLDDGVLNETNLAFHQQVALASQNTVLQQLLGVLTKVFSREQRLILDIQNMREQDHAELLAIVAALKQRQKQIAVSGMRAHLENVQQVLQDWDPARTPLN
ncbi:MAG: FadR family transcriptional regulator [Phycisphaerae bacterium]|nr:FadR family transcriptional regulator [Gemmatimonadaceae bacterium]